MAECAAPETSSRAAWLPPLPEGEGGGEGEQDTRRTSGPRASTGSSNAFSLAAAVISDDDQGCVDHTEREHCYPGVAAIVEHRQEIWIKSAQRPDAQNDMQEEECRSAKSAHEHDLVGHMRKEYLCQHAEDREI